MAQRIPFVIISMLQSAYNVVDTFTVVKTLTNIGFSAEVAETTIGVISTWGSKLNMIVVSISIGFNCSYGDWYELFIFTYLARFLWSR